MKKRDINIEFLRIVMIFFIIIHHLTVTGFGFSTIESKSGNLFSIKNVELGLINCIVIIGVNVFFIISGYYSIKFNVRKLLTIYIDVFFYSVFFFVVGLSLHKNIGLLNLYAPINNYWYVAVYCTLFILSPFINKLLNYIDFEFFTIMLTIFSGYSCYTFVFNEPFFGVNGGYSVLSAIFMYSLGFYISKYKDILCKVESKLITINRVAVISLILNMLLVCFWLYMGKGKVVWVMYRYNNPLIIVYALSIFVIFNKINIKSRINSISIQWISPNILAIYLIHTNSLIAEYRNKILLILCKSKYISYNVILMILYAIIILILCVLVNITKEQIFRKLGIGKMILSFSELIGKSIVRYRKLIRSVD